MRHSIRWLSAVLAATALLAGGSLVAATQAPLQSGVSKGDRLLPFHPKHVAGPDKGTKACPV